MEFEPWLRTMCFQKPTPEAYDLAKCAFRAGLLHAAEQDEGIAKLNDDGGDEEDNSTGYYRYSAVCHREAADDLKETP